MLKSYAGWAGGGWWPTQDFSVSQRPLDFGFFGLGFRGLGPGLDNKVMLKLLFIDCQAQGQGQHEK